MADSLIFVDVDGVLNPENPGKGFSQYVVKLPMGTFKVHLNPELGDWLEQLAVDTESELVWGTSWEEYAPMFIAPIVGLPGLPVMKIQSLSFSSSFGQNKAYSADQYAQGRKFVYFDDEYSIGYHLESPNGKHIWVDPEFGLRREHIVKAENYLNS